MDFIYNRYYIDDLVKKGSGSIIKIKGYDCIYIICKYSNQIDYRYLLEMPSGVIHDVYDIISPQGEKNVFAIIKRVQE